MTVLGFNEAETFNESKYFMTDHKHTLISLPLTPT